ncbi:MAG: tRNA preQ1(34) S-adenosylmethionine ribosyltransferase-isomerase QueA [Candidatus Tectomicrobia bacterium]|uniref:S-adenosylmethionine:tRNA ribosyltransferase-isomerase n=1 Tax=Tectimicrobiota bacterium TaxID=2528274 RepID=A0A938B2U0_UNCTE|nr:tRNA preQ1(34) S-adenosylmethionine ribosyltransferase-isomerase QueA [Candidatus Tectomicrobia bacterium]
MQLQDFDFTLPPELIAQTPAARRDQSRLMVVERATQRMTHDVFANIGHYLRAGDVLVVNDTKVIPARLRGRKAVTGGKVEVLLLHEVHTGVWEVLLKPAANVRPGMVLQFGDGVLRGCVLERQASGTVLLQFTPATVYEALEQCGEVPLPPYIKRADNQPQRPFDLERYQTVYARHPGAVAAPTAGLHFTPALLQHLAQQGIARAAVTLHVGWGTFQPIRATLVEQHRMSHEFYALTAPEAAQITRAQEEGGRVVAVGTTAIRTLETISQRAGRITAQNGWSDLFIYPGYRFQAVEALVTNFHLPCSTLFLLVCAFAGQDLMRQAYRLAIMEGYRFYSYGDAMLIL